MRLVLGNLTFVGLVLCFVAVVAVFVLAAGGALGWCIHKIAPSVEPGAALIAGMFGWIAGIWVFIRGPLTHFRPDVSESDDEYEEETDELSDDEIAALREFTRSIAAAQAATIEREPSLAKGAQGRRARK